MAKVLPDLFPQPERALHGCYKFQLKRFRSIELIMQTDVNNTSPVVFVFDDNPDTTNYVVHTLFEFVEVA